MAAILMYHRIAEPAGVDPWDLVVSPDHFSSHLRLLRASYEVMSLHELVACHRAGRIPPRAIAVTFDDGYVDNLVVAKPLAEGAAVPVTVFLATGFLGASCFWWDRLAEVFAEADRRGVDANRAAEAIEIPAPVTAGKVWRQLRDLPPTRRTVLLDRLASTLGASEARGDAVRPMTENEARRLVGPFVSIGAHTVDHAYLPAVDESRVAQEIGESLRRCERIAPGSLRALAYPYGAHDETVVGIAARLGVACALGTFEAPLTPATLALALPRVAVRDCAPAELDRRLTALCLAADTPAIGTQPSTRA